MAAFSDYLEISMLNHSFRTATFAKLANIYLGLHIGDPTDAATGGAEVSTTATGYARQPLAVADASWSAPADSAGYMAIANLLEVQYGDPTADWGIPSHWTAWTAVTAGELLVHGPILGTLRPVLADDDPVSFSPGSLQISIGQDLSNYLETAWLNHIFRTATFSKPANIYAGLHSADPTDAGGVGEFTGVNYARVPIAVADASWSAPATSGDDKYIANAVPIQFGIPGSEWGTYQYVSFSDAASAGNMLAYTELVTPRNVNANDNTPIFLPGAAQIFLG